LLLHVLTLDEFLFSGIERRGQCVVKILFEILELLWDAFFGVRYINNLVRVLSYAGHASELVDIGWHWIGELGQPDVVVGMVLASDHHQALLDQIVSQLIFWKHAKYSVDKDSFWIGLSEVLVSDLLKSSGVTCVMSVYFLLHLPASHQWVAHVDYDTGVHFVPGLLRGSRSASQVARAMLTPDVLRDENSHTANRHTLGIK